MKILVNFPIPRFHETPIRGTDTHRRGESDKHICITFSPKLVKLDRKEIFPLYGFN